MIDISNYTKRFNDTQPVVNSTLTRLDCIIDPEKIYTLNIENPIVIESASVIPGDWYSENNTVLTFPAGNKIVLTFIMEGRAIYYPITTVNGELNNLICGYGLFFNCRQLTSFESKLPNLINGMGMFDYCSSLTSFDSKLPNLINGLSMFDGCSKLTSFESKLPNLINGERMFRGCSSLTSFDSKLPNLINGLSMFNGCKLDYESVERIVNSLPARTDSTPITIGYDSTKITPDQERAFNDTLVNKKWSVTWQSN